MRKVKFIDSIAGLADPDEKQLDQKYDRLRQEARAASQKAGREFKPGPVEAQIAEHKKQDRYGDVCHGFKRDFAFKPDQEAFVPEKIAHAWAVAGICVLVEEPSKKAA